MPCCLAAIALYHLIEPAPGFLMVAGLHRLRHRARRGAGPFVGLLGLAGGFVTPAIVRTEEPNALGLFAFLLAMQVGTQVLVRRRGWWWLAPIAVAGGLIWVYLWLIEGARTGPDDVWPALFLLATAAATAWSRRSVAAAAGMKDWDAPRVAVAIQFAAALVMGLLVMATGHDNTGWMFYGALSLLMLAIARFQPENEWAAAFTAAMGALTLLAWPWWPFPAADVSRFALTAAAVGGLFAAGGLLIGQWGARSPMRWALLSAIATGLFLGAAYLRLNSYEGLPSWGLISVILAGLHVLAASGSPATASPMPAITTRWAPMPWRSAACSLLPCRWSWTMPGLRWAGPFCCRPSPGSRTGWISPGCAAPPGWRRCWCWCGCCQAPGSPISRRPRPGVQLDPLWLRHPLRGLHPCRPAVPQARRRPAGADDRGGRHRHRFPAGDAGGLIHSFHREALLAGAIDFREFASFTLAWLVIAFVLLQARRRLPRLAYLWGARIVTGIATAALVLGLLLGFNPLFTGDVVGEVHIFNWLLPAYALPAALLALLALAFNRPENRFAGMPGFSAVLGVLALVLGFAFGRPGDAPVVAGTVYAYGDISDAENYAYSAVWLLYGVGLLVAGILRGGRALRYASMAVIMLTVSKVFLFDAAGLSGLYRVASFLGLGICLIGIG